METADQKPKVSVAVVTWNHEQYIARCLQSILMQRTSFPFELVVGVDRSDDQTGAIVEELVAGNPANRVILQAHRIGMRENFLSTLAACRGDYVALLEGDDYWTHAGKLQAQIDFLDAHPECSFCGHACTYVYESGVSPSVVHPGEPHPPVSTPNDFGLLDRLHTSTLVMRGNALVDLPDWFRANACEWLLKLALVQRGRIGYLPGVWSTYWIHSSGVWSSRTREQRAEWTIQVMQVAYPHVNTSQREILMRRVSDLSWGLCKSRIAARQSRSALSAALTWLVQGFRWRLLAVNRRYIRRITGG